MVENKGRREKDNMANKSHHKLQRVALVASLCGLVVLGIAMLLWSFKVIQAVEYDWFVCAITVICSVTGIALGIACRSSLKGWLALGLGILGLMIVTLLLTWPGDKIRVVPVDGLQDNPDKIQRTLPMVE